MTFRISSTFTDSLAKLTGEEQKAVKTTSFDLQMNPANPGMSFHKLDRARDKSFWSVRVGSDIRLIVHRSKESLLLCYVDHHDKAYAWAERRKLATHPKTGAAQLVEIRETVQEIPVPVYVEQPAQPVLKGVDAEELLSYGVPPDWVDEVLAADEEQLLSLVTRLPEEAAEAVLDLAVGKKPQRSTVATETSEPFEHPDAQRRFRVIASNEELEQALAFPWERWTVFLHPDQRSLVEKSYSGPARVSGSAGTGKTVVALHRAAHLAKANPDSRVLLATFSETLAYALKTQLRRLLSGDPRVAERVDVHSLDSLALRLHKSVLGEVKPATPEHIAELLQKALKSMPPGSAGLKFSLRFLYSEWEQVVDAHQLRSWEAYRDVPRLGRKTRLPESQRAAVWEMCARVLEELESRQLKTRSRMYSELAEHYHTGARPPYDFAVVDEAQDMSPAQLRFFASFGSDRPDGLFFAGDLGQRIFQPLFSWSSLGVDIRGRSRSLRVNYRTSHQIRRKADKLLAPSVSDADGNNEDRSATVSVFSGPEPDIRTSESPEDELDSVAAWIKQLHGAGLQAQELGVFVRSPAQLHRAKAAVELSGLAFHVFDDKPDLLPGHASVGTMHLAKGLEFRAVIVMACDDEVLPLQERLESVGDTADLEEIYNTERHLLYVACTRARDFLLVSGVDPVSEFVEDMIR